MRAHDLLQADDIGADGTYGVAQFGQNETAVESRESFMNVDRLNFFRKMPGLLGHTLLPASLS